MPATGAIVQSVGQTKGAIGYIGVAYLSSGVKAIKVSYDEGKHLLRLLLQQQKIKLILLPDPLLYL